MKQSELAGDWLLQAQHDLDAAKALFQSEFWDTCIVLCEQAAEKAIKAVWMDAKSAQPPRTHNVTKLALDLGMPKNLAEFVNELVGAYFVTRYPDSSPIVPFKMFTSEDAQARLTQTDAVLQWAIKQWGSGDDNE